MDRRSFVKTCVGVAGAGALAASGLGIAAGLAIPRKPGAPPVRYYGAHKVAGPAPRGLPYIPVGVENGQLIGKTTIPDPDGGEDINVLDWYKYCGHSSAPGLNPGFTEDNTLTYLSKEEYEHLITPWFKDLIGNPIGIDDFPGDGFGAAFQWRSDGQSGANVITGILARVPRNELELAATVVSPAKGITEDELNYLLENVFHVEGNSVYIGVSSFCTHFCCAPGYREAEKLARPRDAWDNIFCTCHNSNYNHRQPVAYTFAPEVATEAGGFDPLMTRGGGGGGAAGGH